MARTSRAGPDDLGDPTGRSGVVGVVLAAGLSRRYGARRSKLLAELGGEPLVRRVVCAALGSRLSKIVVVIGHDRERVRRSLKGLEVEWAENPAYAEGQSTSVRAGLEHLDRSARAALFLPADQPLVTTRLIDRLIAAWERTRRAIVRPRTGGRPGSPVLWDRSLFSELAGVTGDAGGRQLLAHYSVEALEVEADNPWELADVDTSEDLRALQRAGSALGDRPSRRQT